jgi:hypothetical protein
MLASSMMVYVCGNFYSGSFACPCFSGIELCKRVSEFATAARCGQLKYSLAIIIVNRALGFSLLRSHGTPDVIERRHGTGAAAMMMAI